MKPGDDLGGTAASPIGRDPYSVTSRLSAWRGVSEFQ
jgi:hypothetical protein